MSMAICKYTFKTIFQEVNEAENRQWMFFCSRKWCKNLALDFTFVFPKRSFKSRRLHRSCRSWLKYTNIQSPEIYLL